ncbi:MAG: replication-associated recombination protein A [Clostridia bacterium]|nr:replication-associated recombination protein A [Clostridia bacterium]
MPSPLADVIRPRELDEMVGQRHLLGDNCALRKIIESGKIPNMIFYGPSGIGKTTLAEIIARKSKLEFYKLNGTTCSTGDLKDIFSRTGTLCAPDGVLLYLDEIQYLNKKQQQTLLEFIEDGRVTLVASTTENPYFYVYNAILSRCTVFEFKPVTPDEVCGAVRRAFSFLEGQYGCRVNANDDVVSHIAYACGGDVRKAINSAELCVLSGRREENGSITVLLETAKELSQKSSLRYDRDGDEHYDILSAFQKSLRGSDPDAALHYMARLLTAGDMTSVCRRLMVCACEDVGLAYPMIIPIVKASVDAALQVGLPEAQIPLADAVILVATSPKSNSGVNAIDAAMADVKAGKTGPVPAHLRDSHYEGASKLDHGQGYKYPHQFADHWTPQQYLPDAIKNAHYYEYGDNKNEQAFKNYWEKIKNIHNEV